MGTIAENGLPLEEGDRVFVKVGSGDVLRPGQIDRITAKGAKVTFRWANGRETAGRSFNYYGPHALAHHPDRTPEHVVGVWKVEETEVSSWVMSWIASAPKTEEVGS